MKRRIILMAVLAVCVSLKMLAVNGNDIENVSANDVPIITAVEELNEVSMPVDVVRYDLILGADLTLIKGINEILVQRCAIYMGGYVEGSWIGGTDGGLIGEKTGNGWLYYFVFYRNAEGNARNLAIEISKICSGNGISFGATYSYGTIEKK